MNPFRITLLFLSLAVAHHSFAQQLVKDINASGRSNNPRQLTVVGDRMVFSATDTAGEELWWADSAGNFGRLKDILPGSGSSSPANFAVADSFMYFTAFSDSTGRELWRTDGTESGTYLVKDVIPGNSDTKIYWPAALKNDLVFYTYTGKKYILWRSDGTDTGTIVLDTLYRSFNSYGVYPFTRSGNYLYFINEDLANGFELWRTDGTTGGTALVKNLTGFSANSNIQTMVDLNGMLFFSVYTGTSSSYYCTLYKTDGSAAGTTAIKVLLNGSGSDHTKIGYILGANKTDVFYTDYNTNGVEIWKTNGTTTNNGTVKVSSSAQHFYYVYPMTFLGDKMYFSASNYNDYNNREPWVTDGTPAGTTLLKDINTTKDEYNRNRSSYPGFYTEINGNVLFGAEDDSLYGRELWKTNGKPTGTVLLRDIAPSYLDAAAPPYYDFNVVRYKSGAYFIADDKTHGTEIWTTDGTAAGTKLFIDTDPRVTPGTNSGITSITNWKGRLYFGADDGLFGKELWSSDGTDTGTYLVKNIDPFVQGFDEGESNPDNFAALSNQLLFTASALQTGTELYKTDGTTAGTVLVKDIWTGLLESAPKELTLLNGQVYFSADGDSPGEELFRSNGSATGTVLVKDIYPTSYASKPRNIFNADGFLLFSADDGTHGRELWISRGTTGSTLLVKDLYPGSSGSDPYGFAMLNSATCFLTATQQLWVTDGTATGTVMLKQFNSVSGRLTMAGNLLYFAADNGNGKELWATDGTSAGTFEVMDINPGTISSDPGSMAALDDRIYFSATVSGDRELWRSDGTKAGTIQVKDINSSGSSTPLELMRINRRIYFSAASASGRELWETDGTSAGTAMVMDIRPGPTGSDPQTLFNTEGILYFTADDGVHGRELWKYNSGCNSYSTILNPENRARICSTGGLTITARGTTAGAGNFKWLRNDTLLGVTGTSILAILPGKYQAISDNGSCAADTSDVLLVQKDIPITVSIKPKTSFYFCPGGFVELDAITNDSSSSYAWYLNGNVLGTQVKKTLKISSPGSVTVRVTNQYGCTITSSPVTVGINKAPVVSIAQSKNTLRATPGFKQYQWYKGSTAINGKTADSLIPSTVGIYKVQAMNDSGCTAFSNSINFQFSGIEDLTHSNITLYPNPASDKVLVQTEELAPGSRVRIYDACGKLLYEADAAGKQVVLDVSPYSDGILFIELLCGKKVMRAKLLKQ